MAGGATVKLNMGFMSRVFSQRKYVFQPPPTEGHYGEGGRWVPGGPAEPIEAEPTVLPLTAKDLQRYEAGKYTTEDVKVLVDGRTVLPIETTFQHNGATFAIRELRNYDEVADLRFYVAKKLREEGTP